MTKLIELKSADSSPTRDRRMNRTVAIAETDVCEALGWMLMACPESDEQMKAAWEEWLFWWVNAKGEDYLATFLAGIRLGFADDLPASAIEKSKYLYACSYLEFFNRNVWGVTVAMGMEC